MTDTNIDHEIATRVMGWTQKKSLYCKDPSGNPAKVWVDKIGNPMADVSKWSPSAKIEDAWMVVEEVKMLEPDEFGWTTLSINEDGLYTVFCHALGNALGWSVEADTAPLAICKAALASVEDQE